MKKENTRREYTQQTTFRLGESLTQPIEEQQAVRFTPDLYFIANRTSNFIVRQCLTYIASTHAVCCNHCETAGVEDPQSSSG